MPAVMRECEVCREPFTPKRRDALYCSKACKTEAWRERKRQEEREAELLRWEEERQAELTAKHLPRARSWESGRRLTDLSGYELRDTVGLLEHLGNLVRGLGRLRVDKADYSDALLTLPRSEREAFTRELMQLARVLDEVVVDTRYAEVGVVRGDEDDTDDADDDEATWRG